MIIVVIWIISAVICIFIAIFSWKNEIYTGTIIGGIIAILMFIGSYTTYKELITLKDYVVLEKVTIAENENVKVYYIIRDEEGNKYITTKNVALKIGETIQLNDKEMSEKYNLVKFEGEE